MPALARPALLLAILAPSVLADDPPSREAIAKRAKMATVLVQAQSSTGSGFCVHSSGLFVTNEHVVRNAGETATLILDAGLKTQKVLKAKVLRRDRELDLALLQAAWDDRPVLELGADAELSELAELITFGFPFGTALARAGEYPTISVNVGTVTSLRRGKEGELTRIQLDGAINPGHSGGPVLDRSGKVVGVVVSGIQGSGVNLAIPAHHLRRFLSRPELVFTPPAVPADDRHGAVEFAAQVVALIAQPEPYELELVLGAGLDGERRLPMTATGGTYRARAVAFPAPTERPPCRVSVRYADGTVSGLADDRPVRVGDAEVRLSELRTLRFGAKPEVRLADGRRLTGRPDGAAEFAVRVGGQTLKVDLTTAVEATVAVPEAVTGLSCTVVARLGGKEVGRRSEPMYLDPDAAPSLTALAAGQFHKPVRSGGPVTGLRVASAQGDYIGQGKSYTYTGGDLTVQRNNRGVSVGVASGGWNLLFGGPGNTFLTVGEYDGARRFPFSQSAPGIEFTGNGRGCNTIEGKFVVWELEVQGDKVVKLAVDFVQRCEQKMPPLCGSLRYNSSFH